MLAGCSSQPARQDPPEKPALFTNQTIVDYATESERVAMYNGIISWEGGVEGELTVGGVLADSCYIHTGTTVDACTHLNGV